MRHALLGAICLATPMLTPVLVRADTTPIPAQAKPPAAQTAPTSPSSTDARKDNRAEGTVPSDGVVQPAPDATRDATVRPPNVDPGMAIAPPGTPGGDMTVKPK